MSEASPSSSPSPNFDQCRAPRFGALVPFLVFMAFYLGLSLWAGDFYRTPMPVAFLVASAVAMLLNHRETLANRVEVFARGMGETNIMIMCLIFILSGAFATIAKGMGAVDAAVLIARHLLPSHLMVIGMFVVSCFISTSIGTSCGTIAALSPIGLGLCGPLGIAPAMILGAIVGGAMFGDNLSIISDTTIAATRTQGVMMRDKFLANLPIVIPAFILTLAIYLATRGSSATAEPTALDPLTWRHWVQVIPYLLILVCAVCGMNVMMLLFCGTVFAFAIGALTDRLSFWSGLDLIGKGCLGMSETLIVAILAGGLLKVIRYNGGIDYLLTLIEKPIRHARSCEFGIMLLVAVINLFTANNTVAIVIAGPIAKALSDRYNCSPRRIAAILDTASCVVQGAIPYGAQILIAVGLAGAAGAKVAPTALIANLYYPLFLVVSLVANIVLTRAYARKNS